MEVSKLLSLLLYLLFVLSVILLLLFSSIIVLGVVFFLGPRLDISIIMLIQYDGNKSLLVGSKVRLQTIAKEI